MISDDVRLAFAPTNTFRALISDNRHVSVWRMLRRPLLVALIIGTAVPIMAVQRVTVGLLIASTISFAFVVAIQMAVGAAVIASVPSRRVSMSRALDLWFAGHAPYCVWLLALALVFSAMPSASLDRMVLLATIPAAWTMAIVSAYCQTVLGTSRAGGRWRAGLHGVTIWAIGLELIALTAGGWFQIAGALTRLLP